MITTRIECQFGSYLCWSGYPARRRGSVTRLTVQWSLTYSTWNSLFTFLTQFCPPFFNLLYCDFLNSDHFLKQKKNPFSRPPTFLSKHNNILQSIQLHKSVSGCREINVNSFVTMVTNILNEITNVLERGFHCPPHQYLLPTSPATQPFLRYLPSLQSSEQSGSPEI